MSQQVLESNEARVRSWLSPLSLPPNSVDFDSPKFESLEDYTSLYFFINCIYTGDSQPPQATTKKL